MAPPAALTAHLWMEDGEATDSPRDARRLAASITDLPGGRRGLTKFVQTSTKAAMLAAAERLRSFDRPALAVWAPDRINPPEHGRRWADLLPQGRLIEIPDSYTLIPLDQPGELARAIREFIRDTP